MARRQLHKPLTNNPKNRIETDICDVGQEKQRLELAMEEVNFFSQSEELYQGDIHVTRTYVAAKGKMDEVRLPELRIQKAGVFDNIT